MTKEGMGFFKFSSGTVYAGECSLEYDESKPCAIQSDPNIKALGVKIPCGIENVAYNDCRIDGDVFVVNDQDELLRFYSHGFSFSYDYICSIYGARRECDKMIKLCKVALLTEMLSVKYKGAQDEIGDLIVNKCISEGLPIGVIREILNKVSYYEYEEKLVGQEKKIIIKEWSNTVGVLTFNAKTGKLKTYSIHDSYEWERLFQDQRYLDYYTISSLL